VCIQLLKQTDMNGVGFGIGYSMFPNLTNKTTSPFMNNEFKK
jgi:hypothetical protein